MSLDLKIYPVLHNWSSPITTYPYAMPGPNMTSYNAIGLPMKRCIMTLNNFALKNKVNIIAQSPSSCICLQLSNMIKGSKMSVLVQGNYQFIGEELDQGVFERIWRRGA